MILLLSLALSADVRAEPASRAGREAPAGVVKGAFAAFNLDPPMILPWFLVSRLVGLVRPAARAAGAQRPAPPAGCGAVKGAFGT